MMTNDPRFSLFPSVKSDAPETITLSDFAERISGGEYASQISRIRKSTSKKQIEAEKIKLPAVTISGIFSGGHKAKDIQEHSGLICMDFDLTDNPDLNGMLEGYREQMIHTSFCKIVFISASGKGLAVVCSIDPKQHKASFLTLRDYFKNEYHLNADESCKDVCRPRYVSWDDKATINSESVPVIPDPCYVEGVDKYPLRSLQPLHALHNTPETEAGQRIRQSQEFLAKFDYSDSAPLYRQIVEKNFIAKAGERNQKLIDLTTFLFRATSKEIAEQWVTAFYWYNCSLFNDPLSDHLKEYYAHWENCLNNYTEALNETERDCYRQLSTEQEREFFRICRDLSANDSNGYQAGLFPLSAEQCRLRMGLTHDMQGARILTKFEKQFGIIKLYKPGSKRMKGQQPRANIYLWKLASEEAA